MNRFTLRGLQKTFLLYGQTLKFGFFKMAVTVVSHRNLRIILSLTPIRSSLALGGFKGFMDMPQVISNLPKREGAAPMT